ncbi:MAG: sugar phosphate isomerase/epimerase [Treponema sp.]|nr:sugar phosphate isomerase/epimerase [Treponema sp.]
MRGLSLCGFADEAADNLAGQIKVLNALGWKYLEARYIDGFNINDLDEQAFEQVCAALENTEIKINCLGSSIANHATQVDSDFESTMATVKRAIKRMQRLRIPYIRIMSYAVIYGENKRPLADQKEQKRFEQLRKICGAFLDAGLTPLHENAYNYGSMSWEHTLKLLDAVPGLKLIYDTADSGITPDFRKSYPYPNQDCWEVWEHTKAHVLHIHIKDACRDPETDTKTYLYPGWGDCDVRRILADAISSGYSGNFSIEPHMVSGIHDSSEKSSPAYRSNNFIEYGKITEDLFRGIGCTIRDGTIYPPVT